MENKSDRQYTKIEIPFLENTLFTEDGFLNEACINELNAAIANTPETYERLSDNIEWNTKRLTSYRDITGALAYWLIKQFAGYEKDTPPAHAPGLEEAVSFLTACIRSKFDDYGFGMFSLCDINKLCWEVLSDLPRFKSWNEKVTMGACWLDLSALLHNVCLTIRQERREFDAFDAKFEEENK